MGKRHGLSLRLISIYAAFFTAAALAYAAISPIPLDSEGHVLFRTGAVGRVQVIVSFPVSCVFFLFFLIPALCHYAKASILAVLP